MTRRDVWRSDGGASREFLCLVLEEGEAGCQPQAISRTREKQCIYQNGPSYIAVAVLSFLAHREVINKCKEPLWPLDGMDGNPEESTGC